MRSRIAVCLAVCALGIMLLAAGNGPPSRHAPPTADDLWAEAILYSLPVDGVDADDVVRKFDDAIAAGDDKAAVYVSLGDFHRGPHVVASIFTDLVAEVAVAGPESNKLEAKANSLIETIRGADPSIQAYFAATEVDPDCAVAWYRLACHATGDVRLTACRWLQEHRPENALGWYLEAIHHSEGEDVQVVLECIQRGNERAVFRTYPAGYPQQLTLVYPREFDEFAGDPVPASAVEITARKAIDEYFSFADPLRQGLRAVTYRLCDAARAEAARDEPEYAVQIARMAQAFAAKVAAVDPPDGLIIITGIGQAFAPIALLRYLLPPQSADRMAGEELHARLLRFRDLFRESYLGTCRDEIKGISHHDWMRGKGNPLAIEARWLHQVRDDAGFSPPNE